MPNRNAKTNRQKLFEDVASFVLPRIACELISNANENDAREGFSFATNKNVHLALISAQALTKTGDCSVTLHFSGPTFFGKGRIKFKGNKFEMWTSFKGDIDDWLSWLGFSLTDETRNIVGDEPR